MNTKPKERAKDPATEVGKLNVGWNKQKHTHAHTKTDLQTAISYKNQNLTS